MLQDVVVIDLVDGMVVFIDNKTLVVDMDGTVVVVVDALQGKHNVVAGDGRRDKEAFRTEGWDGTVQSTRGVHGLINLRSKGRHAHQVVQSVEQWWRWGNRAFLPPVLHHEMDSMHTHLRSNIFSKTKTCVLINRKAKTFFHSVFCFFYFFLRARVKKQTNEEKRGKSECAKMK